MTPELTANERAAAALEGLLALLTEMREEHDADRAEDAKMGRDGEWRVEWWVNSPEKGRVLYKSEEAAYEGGRYWREHSASPDDVEVYCVETKCFPAETVPASDWAAR